jgi:Ecdysteroid kinase-like family
MPSAIDVPSTIEQVTCEWLTDVLRGAGALPPSASVATLASEPIGVGVGVMALLYRVTPTYAPAAAGPGSIVIKMASQHDETRAVAAGYRFYEREVSFYQRLADKTGLRAPLAYHAVYDGKSGDFVVVMEDLGAARVCDQITGCSVEDAFAVVRTLARHHGDWWNNPRLLDYGFIQSLADPPYPAFNAQSGSESWGSCLANIGDVIPESLRLVGERWSEIGPRIMELSPHLPWTLTHGDLRLDNIFFANTSGDFAVVDWQICSRNGGAFDLAYFLSQSLPVSDRRAHEHHLVDMYHRELCASGVDDYPIDDLWRDYRRAVLFCFCYPMTTAGQLDLVNERAVTLVRTMMERTVVAIEDLDATELIPN